MSAPNPADFKNLIPGATSSLCEKLNKLLVGLSQLVYNWVAFEYNPDGNSLTDDYVTLLCSAQCSGGGTGRNAENPNMPSPTGVSASDGSFATKVVVVWNEVTPPSGSVSGYLVYRSLSTNTDPAGATLVATVSGTTFSYDDTTAIPGTTYNYWVRATNGTDTSSFAGPDSGYSSNYAVTFPAVLDLKCTKGFSDTTSGLIRLVFTAPDGMTSVDVYRNTSNDSGTATLIHADVVCNDTLAGVPTPADGVGVNNSGGTKILIYDQPPSGATIYYYWVKCKSAAPPQISPFSNGDSGWVQIGTGDAGAINQQLVTTDGFAITVPLLCNKMRIVMVGGGGAGAGSSAFWGGGGGGAGTTLLAVIDVAPLQAWTFNIDYFDAGPHSFGNPPAGRPISGVDTFHTWEGKSAILTRVSDNKKIYALGGSNGMYSSSGEGSGGPNGGASIIAAGITASEVADIRGAFGEAAVGSRGGRGGYAFGAFATTPAQALGGTFNGDGVNGSGSGGSSIAAPYTGGANTSGYLVVTFYP